MSVGSPLPFHSAFRTCALLFFVSSTFAISLADPPDATKPANGDEPSASELRQGYRQQESDDVALPFVPKTALSAGEQLRNDAVAWFMAGRLLQSRNDVRRAVISYRKALALDPRAIEVYRHLVPLEFQLGEVEAAILSATKAVEISPEDYELWEMLAAQAAIAGKLSEAIQHLENAAKSPKVKKDTSEYLNLNKNLGVLYSALGQQERAADCFEVVFDAVVHPEKFGLDSRARSRMLADPKTSYERIGQVFLDAKRVKLAEQAFEMAAKSGRVGAGNLVYNRARVLLLSEKPDEALAELQKYLDAQRTTKGRDAYQLLADILEKLNKSDELIGRLGTLAAKDEHNLPLQFFLAERLFAANELDRARQIYELALPQGADANGYIGLARVLRKMNKPGELLELFNRAMNKLNQEGLAQFEAELKSVSADGQAVDSLLAAGRELAKAEPSQLTFEKAYILAGLAKSLDRIDDAIEFYLAAIKARKDQAIPVYVELGPLMQRAHRHADAVNLFKTALNDRHSPQGKAKLLALLARAQLFTGDFKEAVNSIEESLRVEPGNIAHQYEEAWIYMHARKWEDAAARFEKLAEQAPDNPRLQHLVQFSLSNLYVQKGDLRKGEEILEKIMQVDPEDTQLNNDLGYLWADQGKNLERAEKMIRKAVASDPDNAAYLDSLGWVLFKLGKFEEAVGPIETAVKKGAGDNTLWDHLGDVQLQLKQVDKAVESWQKALKGVEEDKFADPQLMERIKDKLKQHARQSSQPKPAVPGAP